jgi:ACT domain-containing protein
MKAIITVIGKDKKGIIAAVSTLLAENDVNIEDISQTILHQNFTMIMYVDISGAPDIERLQAMLNELGKKLEVNIEIRHEDIFNAMHRL